MSAAKGNFPPRNEQLLKKYGITEEIYEKILAHQQGVCAICHNHQRYKRLAVDHDHSTGQVRGLLCENCNRGLGRFFDSPFRLQAAAEYINKANKVYKEYVCRTQAAQLEKSKTSSVSTSVAPSSLQVSST